MKQSKCNYQKIFIICSGEEMKEIYFNSVPPISLSTLKLSIICHLRCVWNTPVCVHVNSQLLVRYNSHFSNEDRFKCLYLYNTSVENAAVFKIRKHFARKACLFNLRRKLHLILAVVISCLCCIGRHWNQKDSLNADIYIDLNCVCYETVYSFQRFLQYIWTSFV